MSAPDPLIVLLQDQVNLSIAGWVNRSRKNYITYDGSTYRNLFPNQIVTVKPSNDVAITTWGTDTANVQVAGSPGAATVVNDNGTSDFASRVFIDDSVAAVAPHIWMKVRTRVEFWDGVIGWAMKQTVDTTSGSAELVVGSTMLLTPGQAISGAGIPSGAVIVELPFNDTTKVIISHEATATATVEATLTGSNYVGGYWEDESLGDATEVKILQ